MKLSHESPVSPPRGPMGGGAFIVAVREHSLQYMYHTIHTNCPQSYQFKNCPPGTSYCS